MGRQVVSRRDVEDTKQTYESAGDLLPGDRELRLAQVVRAIDDEPEFDDQMPDEMRQALTEALETKDVDVLAKLMVMVVQMTKTGIKARVMNIKSPLGD